MPLRVFSPQHGTRVFDIIEDFCIGKLKEWRYKDESMLMLSSVNPRPLPQFLLPGWWWQGGSERVSPVVMRTTPSCVVLVSYWPGTLTSSSVWSMDLRRVLDVLLALSLWEDMLSQIFGTFSDRTTYFANLHIDVSMTVKGICWVQFSPWSCLRLPHLLGSRKHV